MNNQDPASNQGLNSKIHDAFQSTGAPVVQGSQFQTASGVDGQTTYQFTPKSPMKRPSTGFWRKAVAGVAGLAVIAVVGVGGVVMSNQLNTVDTDSRSQASADRVPTLQVEQPQAQADGSVRAVVTYDGSLVDASTTVTRLEATITVTRAKAAQAPTLLPNSVPGDNTSPILKTFEGFEVVGLSSLFEFTKLDVVPSTSNPLAYQVLVAAKVKNPSDANVQRQLKGRLQLLSLDSRTGQTFLAQLEKAQFWGFLKRAPGVEVLLGRPSLSVPKRERSTGSQETPKVCAMDAKICPDGSSVSRDAALNCQFPACPEVQQPRPLPTPMPPQDLPNPQAACGNKICESGEASQENCPTCPPGQKVCPKYACTIVPGTCPEDCR